MKQADAQITRPLTVWILQTGEPLHLDDGDRRPMRAMNVANALISAGHRAVIWSAAFSHQEKRQRLLESAIVISSNLEYRLIPSPGYRRNIGLGRLWDHAVLAVNLRRLLRAEVRMPDVCFIGFPPIEAAAVMTEWLKKRNVPTMLDVKDQWPTMFLASLREPLRVLGKVALSPYYFLARRAMKDATGISSMADSFLEWALALAGRSRSPDDLVVPLTSPSAPAGQAELASASEWWAARGVRPDGKARFCFIGSHTRSFDFSAVIAAAKSLAANNVACDLIICGTGECSRDWQEAAHELPNVVFPGWVDSAQIQVLAGLSSGFIAPYIESEDFELSVPNKVIDALSHGLPIITPLKGEVAALIDQFDIGLRYSPDSARTLYDCLTTLIDDQPLQQRMSHNALRLHEERFSYEKVYGELVAHLEKLASTAAGAV